MRWRYFVLFAAACRSVPQPSAEPTAPSEPRASASPARDNVLETNVDAAAPAKVVETPRWGKLSETSGDLYSVVDGACRALNVSLLENEAFVHFADNAIARVTSDGVALEPALSAGLNNVTGIHAIVGHWPDRAYATFDNGARCNYTDLAARWDGTRWRAAFALPESIGVTKVTALGSGAIGIRECPDCGVDPSKGCQGGVFMGDNAKAPAISTDGFQPNAFSVLPSGELYAIGRVCNDADGCRLQFRWAVPGAKLGYRWLPKTHGSGAEPSVVAKSAREVYFTDEENVSRFDGTKIESITAPGKRYNRILGQGTDGLLWLDADDKVWLRKIDGSFDDITPPGYAAGGSIEGLPHGVAWSHTKSAVYKRSGAAWQKVELPRPPYTISDKAYLTPERIAVRSPDDVLVIASYFEQEPGWNEVDKRRTLLRTKRPAQTLRCSATGSLQSWPPPATAACTTPFVFFSEVSSSSPKDYDYPTTRKVLAAKVTLVDGGSIAELRENGHVWNGVVPRSLADGRALAELYARQFPMSRPEVVCATPTITRRIPIVR